MAIDGFTLATQSEVFKINYDKKSANMYNSDNVLQGRIVKKYDFTGSEKSVLAPLSFSGGVGSGRLPKSNAGNYKQAQILSKRVYATCELEREAIHASANDKGAFVRATQETVKKTVESYMRNTSRILFGNGSGVLGAGNGTGTDITGAGTEISPYLVQFPASVDLWKEANWEEEDYVQVVTAYAASPLAGTPEGGDTEANLLRVQAVDPSTHIPAAGQRRRNSTHRACRDRRRCSPIHRGRVCDRRRHNQSRFRRFSGSFCSERRWTRSWPKSPPQYPWEFP